MSNTWFQFKQFNIEQARSAMRVTTDACIQGAWTPLLSGVTRVLDIGAGTGLLALMLAQRNADVLIDAIEYDADAAGEAKENAAASAWGVRINVVEGDVRNYAFAHKYDLIITNPPFFSNSLLSNNENKDIARHTLHLSQQQLLNAIINNLAADGYASILLPTPEYQQWKTLAQQGGLYESARLSISHTSGAPAKRVVGLFSKNEPSFVDEETLVIKDDAQNYTPEFTALLSSFYLQL